MSNEIDNAALRIAAIAKEALAFISVTADAYAYFLHQQDSFPYFTVRLGPDEVGFDSQDFDRDTYTFLLRLVIGHITEGYVGEPEGRLFDYVPVIKTYFNARELLQSDAYPTALTSLIESRCTTHRGFTIFQNTGLSAVQVGTEFTISLQFDETITQAYT